MTRGMFDSLVPGELVVEKATGRVGVVGNKVAEPKGPGAIPRVLVVFAKGTEDERAAWVPYTALGEAVAS